MRQRIEGSNPSLSAKKKNANTRYSSSFFFLPIWGIRTGWQSASNEELIVPKQRANQTTDETVVCNIGVIANAVCGANPSLSAKIRDKNACHFYLLFFTLTERFERERRSQSGKTVRRTVFSG